MFWRKQLGAARYRLKFSEQSHAPLLPAGRTAKSTSSGLWFVCSVLDDDSVWCWGNNQYGQLGNGINDQDYLTPTQVCISADDCSAPSNNTVYVYVNVSGPLRPPGPPSPGSDAYIDAEGNHVNATVRRVRSLPMLVLSTIVYLLFY